MTGSCDLDDDDADLSQPEKPLTVEEWEGAMRAEAAKNDGTLPTRLGGFFDDNKRLVRLPDTARPSPGLDTEALLNGLIDDCRFLIKEVVFHSARLTPDANDRLRFLASAETLAITAAKVGGTIAELRGNKPSAEAESRYRMIVEHVESASVRPVPARKGGGRRRRGKSA